MRKETLRRLLPAAIVASLIFGCGSTEPSGPADSGTGSCGSNGECPSGSACYYAIGSCDAKGACIENPSSEAPLCGAGQSLCGCGAMVSTGCGFPNGYATGPTTGESICADGGSGTVD
jgi:hypothetical protein